MRFYKAPPTQSQLTEEGTFIRRVLLTLIYQQLNKLAVYVIFLLFYSK